MSKSKGKEPDTIFKGKSGGGSITNYELLGNVTSFRANDRANDYADRTVGAIKMFADMKIHLYGLSSGASGLYDNILYWAWRGEK